MLTDDFDDSLEVDTRKLYFLWTQSNEITGEFSIGPIAMIKTSKTEGMYLAAEAIEVAERIRELCSTPSASVIASSDLPPTVRASLTAHRILVLDSINTLDKLFEDSTEFPFEKYAIPYQQLSDF